MNYDKQKPIDDSKILEISKQLIGCFVRQIPDYPKNNTHLEIILPIYTGFSTLYNADEFTVKHDKNGKSICQKENKWVVVAEESYLFDYNKQFENPIDAVKYVYKTKREILENDLKEVNKYESMII